MENWKDIPGYDGVYQVSDYGNVYSRLTNKVLSTSAARGYARVLLSNKGTRKTWLVHRLVGIVFLDNKDQLREINHINGIKNDNREKNLEWVSSSDNSIHAYRVLGKKPVINMLGRKNETSPNSKPVQQLTMCGTIVKEWPSTMEVRRVLGFKTPNISEVANGKRNHAHGFKWRYV